MPAYILTDIQWTLQLSILSKHAVDDEGKSTLSSVALNALDTTAQRMANIPALAANELAMFRDRTAAVVRLHTGRSDANITNGLPSAELQNLMMAWLGHG